MRFSAFLTLAASILFLSACTTDNGKYSVITTKDISLYDIKASNRLVAKDINNRVSRHVAIIIPNSATPTIAQAVDQVLQKYNGDYLANVDVMHRSFQLMWLYHYTAWQIEGDVMKLNK